MAVIVKTNDIVSKFKEYVDKAVKENEIITVSRPKNENVVIVSEKEFQENVKAKRNMEYLAMLKASDEQYRADKVVVKTLDALKEIEASME